MTVEKASKGIEKQIKLVTLKARQLVSKIFSTLESIASFLMGAGSVIFLLSIAVAVVVAIVGLSALITMLVWNYTASPILGFNPVTIWGAFGLNILFSFIGSLMRGN